MLDIRGRTKGAFAGIDFEGTVAFQLKDKTIIEIYFVDSKWIGRIHWGRIELKTTNFYDKINKLASENEGKKIDILKDNE